MAIATGNDVKFVYVTGNALPATPDQDTIYFVAGAQELYVGSALIANYDMGTMHLDDLSVVDTGTGEYVTGITYNTATGEFTLTRADEDDYTFTVTTTTGGNFIAGASYDASTRTLTLTEGVLPEYSLGVKATANTGYAKTYELLKDGTAVAGSEIDIPKDMVVSAGEVKTVTTADQPYPGAQVGDKYIDLTIANASSDHLYIPVKDLVDVYTGGTHITVSASNEISHDAQGANTATSLGTDSTTAGSEALHVSGQVQYDALGHVISVVDKDIASAVIAIAKNSISGTAPISVTNGVVSIATGDGLEVSSNALALKVGDGLEIDSNGAIANSNPVTWTVV